MTTYYEAFQEAKRAATIALVNAGVDPMTIVSDTGQSWVVTRVFAVLLGCRFQSTLAPSTARQSSHSEQAGLAKVGCAFGAATWFQITGVSLTSDS